MILFHNLKKLFLLLFLLQPMIMRSMEEDRQLLEFYLVVGGQHKTKCRILHQLLDGDLGSKVKKTDQVYKDLQTVQNVYKELDVAAIIHKDFQVQDLSDRFWKVSGHLYKDAVNFTLKSTKEREEVFVRLACYQRMHEVEKSCKELPFELTICTSWDELNPAYAKYLCDQYEDLDVS